MRKLLILVFILLAINGFAQSNLFYVPPILSNGNYAVQQDSHLVVRNNTTNLNKLFLFIGGTGSKTRTYRAISEFAGDLGYDVINISYPNDVAAASLANSSNPLVFDEFRQEICFGTPVSSAVAVDSLNSIFTRTVNLLKYLDASYPSQNWGQYLTGAQFLDWSKIAVGGHSQGSGHACFFGKQHAADRVLMFSGPNDYSISFTSPANWLSSTGNTGIHAHYAYLSLLDEIVAFEKQFANMQSLGLYPSNDTIDADQNSPPYGGSRFLYTRQAPGLAILNHNSPVKKSQINDSVWTYMLTANVLADVPEANSKEILLYPNPSHSTFHIQSGQSLLNQTFSLQNIAGQTVMKGRISDSHHFSIDLSSMPKGLYFLKLDQQSFKVLID